METIITRRLVRMAALESYLGCNRSTIYRWQKDREFPKPFRKSATSSTYDLALVDAWLESQKEGSQNG